MGGTEKEKVSNDRGTLRNSVKAPLIFISHDSRDAELAEAFSRLLKSVSGGVLKSFRSSDKEGTEGIEFGDEWYKRLMSNLESASDVVCLFTERSLDRPWILYEAGVAKGTLGTPVHGIALGIPLNRVSVGPFYQFHNSDDSEESLTKLVMQLLRRIPAADPEPDAVKTHVQAFKAQVTEVLERLSDPEEKEEELSVDGSSVARLFEEAKVMFRDLPSRIQDSLDSIEPIRRRRIRRLHPKMIGEMIHMASEDPRDPIGIVVIASLLRDDFPWLYEIGMEAYRAARSGDARAAEELLVSFQRITELTVHGPFMMELGLSSKESHMMIRELESLLHGMISLFLEGKREGLPEGGE